jgi:Flp pilus assembly CpaF family ATPase
MQTSTAHHTNPSLEDWVRKRLMTAAQASALREAIGSRKNVLIVGMTAVGKTTLASSLIAEALDCRKHARLAIVEEVCELAYFFKCASYFPTTGDEPTQQLRAALQSRPDFLVLGEVRGPAAWDLVDAWQSKACCGITTIHGGSAFDGIRRLAINIHRHPNAPADVVAAITGAVDVVVNIQRVEPGRRVTEILALTEDAHSAFKLERLA